MTNSDLHRQWLKRYAERISRQPPLPPAGGGTPPTADPINPNAGGTVPPAPSGVITFKSAFLLKGQFGEEFLKEFNGRVKRDYDDADALKVLKWDAGANVVMGSNPYAVVLANQILHPQGIRTATQAELETILNQGTIPFKDHYEESSLVWRSDADPNAYLSQNLSAQLRKHMSLNAGSAYVIPLNAFGLRKDTQSPSKLAFALQNPQACFEASILMKTSGSYIDSSKMDVSTGLPSQVYSADPTGKKRRFWTSTEGLLRLYLDWDFGVNSDDGDLASSYSLGQVVCVSGEAAGANLAQTYLNQQNVKLQEVKDRLDAKYQAGIKEINALAQRFGVK